MWRGGAGARPRAPGLRGRTPTHSIFLDGESGSSGPSPNSLPWGPASPRLSAPGGGNTETDKVARSLPSRTTIFWGRRMPDQLQKYLFTEKFGEPFIQYLFIEDPL